MAVVLVRDVPEKGFSSTEVSVSERVVEDYLKRGWKIKNKKVATETQSHIEEKQSKKDDESFFSENTAHSEKITNAEKSTKTKKN